MKRIIALCSLPLSMSVFAQEKDNRPNILIMIADDMARCELGCYGGQNISTPNIDKLASEGIQMTNNFASMAISVPIRASMYTGLYPIHHGSYRNHKPSYNVKSVTHYFTEMGYRVGRTGKDHPVNQPQVYGFEKIPGFAVGCTMSHPPISTTNGITEFMNRNDNQPFCLFVCSINSHMPWDAGDPTEFDPNKLILPPNCVDNAKTRQQFCDYLAEIRLFDNEVGKVMKALEETGKADNTLVILLSEQGPQMPFGKWTCYRYGQASAMIARFPGKIKAGSQSDALVQYEDILPTIVEAVGSKPIKGLDGISQYQVLTGHKSDLRKWAYGMHNNLPEGPSYPIRSIQDKRFKLIENLCPDSSYYEKHMMSNGDNMWQSWLVSAKNNENAAWLSNRFVHRPAIEFYDLKEDPWELKNLANDPQYKERISVMDKELKRWMKEQGDRGAMMDNDDSENPELKTPKAITTYGDFKKVIEQDLSGNYYLAKDIVLPKGTEWVPIGASSKDDIDPQRFRGILDGRGHSIVGITIKNGTAFKGLFGRMDHAVLRNIKLQNIDIKGAAPSGGVTGAMMGASTIENVSITGSIQGNSEVGGIAGRIARDPSHTGFNKINDCQVKVTIKSAQQATPSKVPENAKGIVGSIHSNINASVAKLNVDRSYFTGTISSN